MNCCRSAEGACVNELIEKLNSRITTLAFIVLIFGYSSAHIRRCRQIDRPTDVRDRVLPKLSGKSCCFETGSQTAAAAREVLQTYCQSYRLPERDYQIRRREPGYRIRRC